jgi:hypothetical protein
VRSLCSARSAGNDVIDGVQGWRKARKKAGFRRPPAGQECPEYGRQGVSMGRPRNVPVRCRALVECENRWLPERKNTPCMRTGLAFG